jgi:O-antigen/teichoic acid export membrane protein
VRPRRTGLIVFTSRMISVFTGFLFLVMITRWLGPSQFGLWEFIIDLVVFSSFPVGLFTYWATREVARGIAVGRTTLVLCTLLSLVGIVLFLLFTYGTYASVGSSLSPFFLAIILVPLTYWNLATQALVQGHNPAIGAYSLLVSEPAKLIVAYPLLYYSKVGIYGVIVAIAVSYVVQSGLSTLQLRGVRTDKVDLGRGKVWLKDYYVPAVYTLTNILIVADTFVASVGQGGTNLAGFYQAAFQVATIVSYSTFLSVALYPLLLRGSSERLPGQILEFSLLFGMPMAVGAMVLAPKILYLLRPVYVESTDTLVILSLAALATLVSTVFDQTLMGRERADLSTQDRTRRIVRSDLMFVPVANIAYSAVYLVAVFVLAKLSVASSIPVYQFGAYWALAQLVLTCVLVAVKLRRLRKKTSLVLTRSVLFFAASSVLMGVSVHLVGVFLLPAGLDALDYGLRLLFTVLSGGAVYFAALFALDWRFRALARALATSVKFGP